MTYCEATTFPGTYLEPPEFCDEPAEPGSEFCEGHNPDRADEAAIERAEDARGEER